MLDISCQNSTTNRLKTGLAGVSIKSNQVRSIIHHAIVGLQSEVLGSVVVRT